MFNPRTLHPDPDPFFVHELRKIDPELRIVWGWDRYLKNKWVVERRIPPERYFEMYESFLTSGGERFVDTPIYDHDRPILDEWGDEIGHEIVGYHRFDLAPEWEYVLTVETLTGDFKPFDGDTLLEIRRMYAWNRTHLISRAIWEENARKEKEAKEAADHAYAVDVSVEAYDEARRAAGVKVQSRPIAKVLN